MFFVRVVEGGAGRRSCLIGWLEANLDGRHDGHISLRSRDPPSSYLRSLLPTPVQPVIQTCRVIWDGIPNGLLFLLVALSMRQV